MWMTLTPRTGHRLITQPGKMMNLPQNDRVSIAPKKMVVTGLDQSPEQVPSRPVPATTRKLDGVKFYRVCEALKEERARFMEQRPTHVKAAEMLSQMVGFEVPGSAIPNLQEATGVVWSSGSKGAGRTPDNRVRRLIGVIRKTLMRNGFRPEDMPELEELYRVWNRGGVIPQAGGDDEGT